MKTKRHNLSLQGISGLLFSFFNLIVIFLVNYLFNQFLSGVGPISLMPISFFQILIITIGLLYPIIAYFLVIKINKNIRKKYGLIGWDENSLSIRTLFIIEYFVFSILAFVFLNYGLLKFIIPTSMLLYGAFCIIASSFTLGYTKILGYFFILQSLLAVLVPEAQFFLWGMAFGGFHFVYAFIYKLPAQSN